MWWWGLFPLGWLLIAVLLFGLLRARRGYGGYACRGCGWGSPWPGGGATDAEAILKRRLANGEITEGDYQRLREALSR
jgi:hypothetical protein